MAASIANRRSRHLLLLLGVASAAGCGSDTTGPMTASPSQLFYTLQLNYHAVNLALSAPYDTVQLSAVARAADGSVLSDIESVQYSVADSSITVSPTGLLTAHYKKDRTAVIATATVRGVTLGDTVIVQVAQTPLTAPLATLSIQPHPPDGLTRAADFVDDYFGTFKVPYYVTLTNGDTVCKASGCSPSVVVAFATSDPNIATINQSGFIQPKRIGHVTFSVSTVAYGVVKTDSLPFVIGYPGNLPYSVAFDSTSTPPGLLITPAFDYPRMLNAGGRFSVTNRTPEPLEISVSPSGPGVSYLSASDPAKLKDTLFSLYAFRFVRVDSAGTYTITYRSLSSGAVKSQTLVVKDYP